jgi:4-aminobutyrate aminotransferase
MGRTGKFLAHQHWEVEPDIVCLAKGLASGMPLGAFLARAELMNWDPGSHGSTFGGNPVACVAALATLDLVQGGLMENAATVGSYLLEGLRRLAAEFPRHITDARGLGLMLAVELKDTATASSLMERAFRTGLLLLPTGSRALRLCPPLVLTEEEASTGLDLIRTALAGL